MNATAIKSIDKSKHTGLSTNKKKLLKSQMGSASANVDLNKVLEWWKYEHN
ncbi:hypothetical protein ACTHAL_000288 [Priestia flexa]|uniref:hypothetical protein n=1 Tax=Bacillaceae TaxID=186817 RepID=UPI000AEBD8F3|nr:MULTISPECIES: hypothetical protein [Bacillaceae]